MDALTSWRVWRAKLFEMGHSFDEIDNMNIEDMGYVIAYINETNMIKDKRAAQSKRRSKGKSKSKKN